jgi:hypothetical protein
MLGPHLETLVVDLHHAHPLSYQRVQHILRDRLDTSVRLGGLVSTVKRNTVRLQQAAVSIQAQIRCAPVVGSDETGVRVGGEKPLAVGLSDPALGVHAHPPPAGGLRHSGCHGRYPPSRMGQ